MKKMSLTTKTEGVIGQGIEIKGSLSGDEPLIVEGKITGQISLNNHLTIKETAEIHADIETVELTVNGTLEGKIQASELITVNSTAEVSGELYASRIIIEEGARFNGRIEMDFELPEGV
jgi:cytoskeletal protein CcmA (bactofilin family)